MFECSSAQAMRLKGKSAPAAFLSLLIFAALFFSTNSFAQTNSVPPTNFPVRLDVNVWRVGFLSHPALTESSGVTASKKYPGVFWTHRDDGDPFIFAVNRRGEFINAFEVKGANMIDWEAISADDFGNLYLADIGSDGMERTHSAIHRVEEPDPFGGPANAIVEQTWLISYPGARQDAESFFALNGYGYLITKQRVNDVVSMYRFLLGSSTEYVLEFVSNIAPGNDVGDAAISDDHQRLALVTDEGVEVYFINGDPSTIATASMAETEYENDTMEGITFVPDGLLVTSEDREVLLFDSDEFTGEPIITTPLENETVYLGDNALFRVVATGFPNVTFRWLFNGSLLRGETNNVLVITNATLADAGLYEVIVSNANGTARSSATLTVLERTVDLRITEVMSDPNAGAFIKGDWWELTSFHTNMVDIGGWRFLDSSEDLTNAFVIPTGTIIRPGESIIFVQDLTPAQFRAWWGANNIPAETQIITYTGFGFSNLGDELRLWTNETLDPSAVYARETFGPAENGVSFGYDPAANRFGDLSVVGVNGAFPSADRADVGSPGRIRNSDVTPTTVDLRITEVMSNPSLNPATFEKADWWELTSFDTNVVNLRGWSFDDGSDDTNGPYVIPNDVLIMPGESIIFVEDLTPEQFRAWWGETNFAPGTQIITYSGGGLSFSSLGDSIRLWTTNSLELFLEESFGPAAPGVSFVNNPATGDLDRPSQVGVDGAFPSADSLDVGSPGRISGEVPPGETVDVRITEVMSSPNGMAKEDWFELTSFDTNVVDLSGWRFNDSSGDINDAFIIPAGISIEPGESIVFVENLTAAEFLAWWGTDEIEPDTQIITYSGTELSFSSLGDSLRLWTTNTAQVYRQEALDPATTGVSFGYDPETEDFGQLSQDGVDGAFISADGLDVGSPGRIRNQGPDTIDVRITEVMSSEALGSPQEDWWELTSFDTVPVDLSGWRFNDSAGGLTDPFTIPQGVMIAPGESIIFVENLTAAEFLSWWGSDRVSPTTQIITYTGVQLSFSSAADELNIWTNGVTDPAAVFTNVTFGAAQTGVTFTYNPDTQTFGGLSQDGVNGAFRAAGGADIGSPGRIRGAPVDILDLRITEVMSSETPESPEEDWWELTNFENEPIDLSGWRFNDNGGDAADAFEIPVGTIIQPNETIVFVEDLTPLEFRAWWGEANLPAALKIITYTGTNLSFSATEDAVRLWTTNTNSVFLQVGFGAADLGVSFSYNPNSGELEKSTNNVNGAFIATTGDVGSPGRTQNPAQPLTLQFSAGSLRIHIAPPTLGSYALETTDDLATGEWVSTGQTISNTSNVSFTLQGPGADSMRFYRLRPL